MTEKVLFKGKEEYTRGSNSQYGKWGAKPYAKRGRSDNVVGQIFPNR